MNSNSSTKRSVKGQLLASSPTIAGITQCINNFWISTEYSVDPETLQILHPSRRVNPRVRVVLKRGRYRFELLPNE